MSVSDEKKIVAFIIVILLYALVPILLFFLSIGSIVAIIYFFRFIYTGNISDGVIFFIFTLALVLMLNLLLKLIHWLKK